ncbi:hypothetical protein Tco_1283786 [Tanacetum coccineum]
MEYLHEKFRHHHRVDEMTCLDDEKMKKIQNDVPCHDHFENESWNNRFVDLKETIEANVSKETLDVVGFIVGLINNTTFVNVAVFNRFVELGNGRVDAGNFGYFWHLKIGFEGVLAMVFGSRVVREEEK